MLFQADIIEEAVHSFSRLYNGPVHSAVVLGSGLADCLKTLDIFQEMPFSSIKHLKTSTVAGHRNKFLLARFNGRNIIIQQGRIHMYEGHSAFESALPLAVMATLGAKSVIITNAAGGVNPDFNTGDIMAINDHINFQGQNPLTGSGRFVDMCGAYDTAVYEALETAFSIKRGVYIGVSGPSYETPAEIRFFRSVGADAVGMSTVMETIIARYFGLQVCGFSMITNLAAGIQKSINHDEVLAAGRDCGSRLGAIITAALGFYSPPPERVEI